MTVQEQQYLTAADVTALLRIDKSTVYRMAEDGRLPGFKVGRQWRFRAEDVATALGVDVTAPARATTPIDLHKAEGLAGLFADLFDVMVVVTDLEGRPLTQVINRSPYFDVLSRNPAVVETCALEWRGYAHDPKFAPHFKESHLGFLCARGFVRSGFELVAMVIAGGVAPQMWPDPDRISEIAITHDLSAEDLLATAPTLPSLDDVETDAMLSALNVLARHLSPDTNNARSES